MCHFGKVATGVSTGYENQKQRVSITSGVWREKRQIHTIKKLKLANVWLSVLTNTLFYGNRDNR